MKHPYHDMTTEKALAIARNLKYGPLPKPSDPTPGLEEAWELVNNERHTCGHTWITGDAALDCISWSMANPGHQVEKGRKAKGKEKA